VIENGIVNLLNSTPAITAIAPIGGFYGRLPQDQTLPSWSYMFVTDETQALLRGPDALITRRLQIDCYGEAKDVIRLAYQIDKVLNGFKGRLSDSEATEVNGCFPVGVIDFPEDTQFNFRRTLEYNISFYLS
jgi:hypothetical protein